MRGTPQLGPYLQHLRKLPFVRRVTARPIHDLRDFEITITTPKGRHRLVGEVKRSHLGHGALGEWLARRGEPSAPSLLLAPYVSPEMSDRLTEAGVGFVDRVGNCHLDLGGAYVAHVVGRRPVAGPAAGGFRAPAYRAVFVLLADPGLAAAPMRDIARLAGVSLGTVASVMKRLRAERFIVGSRSKTQLVGAASLLDRWVSAYADVLRPRLVIGRYDPGSSDPEAVEARIEKALADRVPWAYGGTAAGHRLTRYYRGEEIVVHVAAGTADQAKRQLKALPRQDGNLVLVEAPAPLALKGPVPRVAHPLLVYAEMLTATSPRAAEAARGVRERFLKLP